jgi:polysaccharide export outer membrane protein
MMSGLKGILLIVLIFILPTEVVFSQDYRVGEGDVLKITVYEHNDLTTVARVSGKGTIMFPLIGEVKVEGLTTIEIAKRISELLADGYIVDPQVSVFIQEYRSKKATIMGEVERPGLYELRGETTFLELLSKAGGLTRDASSKAIVKRKNGDIVSIDLKRLIEDGDTSLNITITEGDNIYIPKAGVFYVTGEVKKPDAYKYEKGTTVIKAITMAGGFTDKAAIGRVKIIRNIDGREVVLEKVKMDEPILPDDIIIVPESFF